MQGGYLFVLRRVSSERVTRREVAMLARRCMNASLMCDTEKLSNMK